MDPKDINFTLKTGSDDYAINHVDEVEEENINIIEILSIVTTFSQNSVGSASTYSNHANRDVITKQDIKLERPYRHFSIFYRHFFHNPQFY